MHWDTRMPEYVIQKTWKNIIPFLVAIIGAGMLIGWQAGLRPVFAQSLDKISISLSVFDSRNEAISGTFEIRFALYSQNRSDTDPYPLE